MMKNIYLCLVLVMALFSCNNNSGEKKVEADASADAQQTLSDTGIALPVPYASKSVKNESKVIGWGQDQRPKAPDGFEVTLFADKLESPRSMYLAENGDLFVAQANREGKKGNNIILFRDNNKDGIPETRSVYLSNLKKPYGMLILNNQFYVGNADALVVYPYDAKALKIEAPGKTLTSFPEEHHWTRNLIANSNGSKIYIAVGSGSNVAENGMEKEARRANILEVNPDGSGERIYASGLRNPVGMDWAPGTNTLWTAVNERDELGDDLVPDYLTSVVDGGFYGWPYSYFGKHEDPRIKDDMKRPELVQRAIVPDVALGSHTASLGFVFYRGSSFPAKYQNGAFVAQHGSWNRSHFAGYKVVFIPFANGKATGEPSDFLTGFIVSDEKSEVYGRPVSVAVLKDGSLLVTDDGDGKIWRVSVRK